MLARPVNNLSFYLHRAKCVRSKFMLLSVRSL